MVQAGARAQHRLQRGESEAGGGAAEKGATV
jgi:hypothetical protein